MAKWNYDFEEIFGGGILIILAFLLVVGVVMVIGGWTVGLVSTAKNEVAVPFEELPIAKKPLQEMSQPVAEPMQAQDPPPVVVREPKQELKPEPAPRLQPESTSTPINRSISTAPRSLLDSDTVSVRSREPVQGRPQPVRVQPVREPLQEQTSAHFSNVLEAAQHGSVDDVRYWFDQNVIGIGRAMYQEMIDSGRVRETDIFIDADEKVHIKIDVNHIHINPMNQTREAVLHRAAMNQSPHALDIIKYLVSQGANVNIKNGNDETPLHLTLRVPTPHAIDIVKYLVSQGSDVNAVGIAGNTPLHVAARISSREPDGSLSVAVLRYLISIENVNVNARNRQGQTPLDATLIEEKREILRASGGKSGAEL